MEQSEQINELAAAVCEMQKCDLFALKDSTNPFFKSKYADLSSCWQSVRKPLTDNGLAVVQTMDTSDNGHTVIVTTLIHKSGQWMRGRLPIKPVKEDPQGVGSAITYGRRYSLAAIVGLCPEDDDAERSVNHAPPPKISQAQHTKIVGMLDKSGADIPKFLKYIGVTELGDITEGAYKKAISALNMKLKAAENVS